MAAEIATRGAVLTARLTPEPAAIARPGQRVLLPGRRSARFFQDAARRHQVVGNGLRQSPCVFVRRNEALIADAQRDALTLVTTERTWRDWSGAALPAWARDIVPFAVTMGSRMPRARKFSDRLFVA
jgi:hypothetical protein